jgi:hypothetical protein
MGIGAALAMGLVQGFTKNIQVEKARRLAEDERANEYQKMLVDATIKGDATTEGASAVQKMINDYKDKLDKRGPIGPFGRAADAVTMDMSNIQTALTAVDQNVIDIAPGIRLKVNEDYFTATADDEDRGRMVMDALGREMVSDSGVKFFSQQGFKNFNGVEAFNKFYTSTLSSYVKGQSKFNDAGGIIMPADPRNHPTYAIVERYTGYGSENEYDIAMATVKDKISTPELPQNQILLPPKLTTDGSIVVDYDSLFDPNDLMNFRAMSEVTGYGDDWQKFMFLNMRGFVDVESARDSLQHSARLFELGLGSDKISDDQRENIGNYLLTAEGLKDDARNRAFALMPFLPKRKGEALNTFLEKLNIAGVPTKPLEEEWKLLTGEKLSNFNKRRDAIYKSEKNMVDLIDIVSKTGAKAEGFVAQSIMTAFSFTGVFGDVRRVMERLEVGGDADTIVNKSDIESFMSEQLTDVSQDIAAARTLAFIVAADLARAEDEAGRLSDQDFKRNYMKLGLQAAGDVNAQIAAMNQVLREVQLKKQDIQVLEQIAAESVTGLTKPNRKLLAADRQGSQYQREFNIRQGPTSATEEAAVAVTVDQVISNPETFMLLGGNSSYTTDRPNTVLYQVSVNTGDLGRGNIIAVETGSDGQPRIIAKGPVARLVENGSIRRRTTTPPTNVNTDAQVNQSSSAADATAGTAAGAPPPPPSPTASIVTAATLLEEGVDLGDLKRNSDGSVEIPNYGTMYPFVDPVKGQSYSSVKQTR